MPIDPSAPFPLEPAASQADKNVALERRLAAIERGSLSRFGIANALPNADLTLTLGDQELPGLSHTIQFAGNYVLHWSLTFVVTVAGVGLCYGHPAINGFGGGFGFGASFEPASTGSVSASNVEAVGGLDTGDVITMVAGKNGAGGTAAVRAAGSNLLILGPFGSL